MKRDDPSAGLLREFTETGSEAAFGSLVGAHLNLVYAVALRRCNGQTGMAEDVCQTVFIDLARKACRISPKTTVAGWLYQHASHVAAHQRRAEDRRERREAIAVHHQTLTDDTDWSRIAPLLDDSMLDLDPRDRDSLVLRFLEQRPLAEVGARLGLTENAARMRVARALDKLRHRLAKQGVTSTASALAAAMAGPAATPAPAALVNTVIGAAQMTTTSGAVGLGIFSFMAITKTQLAVGIAVLAAIAIPALIQSRTAEQLRFENTGLRRQLLDEQDRLRAAAEASGLAEDELIRLRNGREELMRLRGELAQLRNRAIADSATPPLPAAPDEGSMSATTWSNRATLEFQQTLATSGWAWNGKAGVLMVTPVPEFTNGRPTLQMMGTVVVAPAELLRQHGLARLDSTDALVLSPGEASRLMTALKDGGATISEINPITPGAEGFVLMGFVEDEVDQTMSFKVAPEWKGERQVSLSIDAERRTLSFEEQQILREPDPMIRSELRAELDSRQKAAGDPQVKSP